MQSQLADINLESTDLEILSRLVKAVTIKKASKIMLSSAARTKMRLGKSKNIWQAGDIFQ